MLHGIADGRLSVRAEGDGGRTMTGRFPYNSLATLSDGGRRGRPRKERFAPHAFEYRVKEPDAVINLLVGHDYGKPLATTENGSLVLEDTDTALKFTAKFPPEVLEITHVKDTFAMIDADLSVGLSPGFRIPPERAVKVAEKVTEEDPAEGMALIRTIFAALLYELSVVTRPAYKDAEVEAEHRNWQLSPARTIRNGWGYR